MAQRDYNGKIRSKVLLELSHHLSLSPWTVSRALNGHSSVREKTRNAVLEAADQLGLSINPLARALRGGTTRNLGVCLSGAFTPVLFHHLITLQEMLFPKGYGLWLESGQASPEVEEKAVAHFIQMRVPAVLLIASLSGPSSQTVTLLRKAGVPFAFLNPASDRLPHRIHLNRTKAYHEVVGRLWDEGHRRFVFLPYNEGPLARQRRRGIEMAIGERGGDPARCAGFLNAGPTPPATFEFGYHLAMRAVEHPVKPTVLLTSNDEIAIGVLAGLREEGIRVPEDISVVGFDNAPVSRFSEPSLTTVDQEYDRVAELCFQVLFGGEEMFSARRQGIPVDLQLHWRGSTGPAPDTSPAERLAGG